MSWLRSAVNKAVEVGGNKNLSRTVRNYADSVVQHAGHAVVEGAKLFQDRLAARNVKNFKVAVKRLEDVSISCRGVERIQLLRRWLVALKESENMSKGFLDSNRTSSELQPFSDGFQDSPESSAVVLYHDSNGGSVPMSFRDVFLCSQALEGITMSMILEAPNDEEVSLLLGIFGLSLTGGREVHNAVVTGIQDLSNALSCYKDEVLIRREELLQYAQGALAGLKISAEDMSITKMVQELVGACALIDAEISSLKKKLDELRNPEDLGRNSEGDIEVSLSTLKEAFAQVQICSRLEELLLKKKLSGSGDSPRSHSQKVSQGSNKFSDSKIDLVIKLGAPFLWVDAHIWFDMQVDKLKVLSESLASSTSKAEKRMTDHRSQLEEALNFRVTKTKEVTQYEKDIASEVAELKKKKDDLETELKRVFLISPSHDTRSLSFCGWPERIVNASLTSALARLHNAREEREQFDEASNQIVGHLRAKEDELARSIASCRAEADVVNTWINFLQNTWALQSSHTNQREKQVNDALERNKEYFLKLTRNLLTSYKKDLEPSLAHFRGLVEKLRQSNEGYSSLSEMKNLVREYLNSEVKIKHHMLRSYLAVVHSIKSLVVLLIISTFNVVESMIKRFDTQNVDVSRGDNQEVKELFVALEKIKAEFNSIERPNVEIETPTTETPSGGQFRSPFHRNKDYDSISSEGGKATNSYGDLMKLEFFTPKTTKTMTTKDDESSSIKEKAIKTEGDPEKLESSIPEKTTETKMAKDDKSPLTKDETATQVPAKLESNEMTITKGGDESPIIKDEKVVDEEIGVKLEAATPKKTMETTRTKDGESPSRNDEKAIDTEGDLVKLESSMPEKRTETITRKGEESPQTKDDKAMDTEGDLAKLEAELGTISRQISTEEISGWEFDALEQDLKASNSPVSKDKEIHHQTK
ncbi:hypothetical protein RJ641_028274 [Dillenia turbinata]|uniref:Uncharacterized protein n=1 Tax=Dillenia turbinata TaxID=194707 RepID=A0AAN8WBN1_9MAGN